MRKFLVVASLLIMSTPAMAQYHRRNPPLPTPRPYVQGQRNILPWVAGGLALGALGSTYYYNNRRRDCWEELIGYDRRGREIWETICN